MTTKAELMALVDRAEKATGPERKLDGDIAAALGLEHGRKEIVHYEERSYEIHDECARHFSSSIDAALTLWDGLNLGRPTTIPSNPRLVAADAIRVRALASSKDET